MDRSVIVQCNHWNDRLPGGIPLRPIQCVREQDHEGRHLCGDTSWSEDLGTRVTSSDDGPAAG